MTDHSREECILMFEKLSEYIDNELDGPTCEEIEKHAMDCIACKICLETLRKTVILCQSLKQEEKPVSGEFSKKLLDFIKNNSAPLVLQK